MKRAHSFAVAGTWFGLTLAAVACSQEDESRSLGNGAMQGGTAEDAAASSGSRTPSNGSSRGGSSSGEAEGSSSSGGVSSSSGGSTGTSGGDGGGSSSGGDDAGVPNTGCSAVAATNWEEQATTNPGTFRIVKGRLSTGLGDEITLLLSANAAVGVPHPLVPAGSPIRSSVSMDVEMCSLDAQCPAYRAIAGTATVTELDANSIEVLLADVVFQAAGPACFALASAEVSTD